MRRSCSLSWPTSIDLVISDKTWNISPPYFTCHWADNSSPDWAWQAAEKGPGGQTLSRPGGLFSSRAASGVFRHVMQAHTLVMRALCKMCESESEFFTAARAHGHVIKCDIERELLRVDHIYILVKEAAEHPPRASGWFYIMKLLRAP